MSINRLPGIGINCYSQINEGEVSSSTELLGQIQTSGYLPAGTRILLTLVPVDESEESRIKVKMNPNSPAYAGDGFIIVSRDGQVIAKQRIGYYENSVSGVHKGLIWYWPISCIAAYDMIPNGGGDYSLHLEAVEGACCDIKNAAFVAIPFN